MRMRLFAGWALGVACSGSALAHEVALPEVGVTAHYDNAVGTSEAASEGRIQRSLLETRAQALSQALDRSRAMIEFTPSGEIISANANFLDTMGYRLSELFRFRALARDPDPIAPPPAAPDFAAGEGSSTS